MGHTPYGYLLKDGIVTPDPVKSEQVKALFNEYLEGAGLQTIANNMGIPRKHVSLGHMIEDQRYIGNSFYPAIVDKDIWIKAQAERKERARKYGRNKNYFALDKTKISPFWGLVFCAECGSEFRRYAEKGNEHWRCSKHIVKGKIKCRSSIVPKDLLEKAFLSILSKLDTAKIAVRPKSGQVKIKQQFSDPFEQAQYLYSISKVDDFDYMTDKLLTVIQDKLAGVDGDFMRKVIKSIRIGLDNTATFELINHKLVKEELIK